MQHIPLNDADYEAIEEWISHGAHLFPYVPETKATPNAGTPEAWCWSTTWFHAVGDAEFCSNEGFNIAFDTSSVPACMIDIDNLMPFKVAEYEQVKASMPPGAKRMEITKAYRDKQKAAWLNKGIGECRRLLDEFAEKVEAEFPAHIRMPSSSQFGDHYYYLMTGVEEMRGKHGKLNFPSPAVEIFANRHCAYPFKWADLKGFHANIPVPLKDILAYWQPVEAEINELRAEQEKIQATAENPAPRLVSVSGDVDYDYEAYLSRLGHCPSNMNNMLNDWVFRAGQLDDHAQVDVARAFARQHNHNETRIESTIKSAWNAGQTKPYAPLERQKNAIRIFQSLTEKPKQ